MNCKMATDKLNLIEIGKAIIKTEHDFFVNDYVDNHEHIPKVKRIIETIQKVATKDDAIQKELYQYALNLFVKEWMASLEDRGETTKSEAIGCFEEIYRS